MKRRLKNLAPTAIGIAAIAAPIVAGIISEKESLTVQRTMPVEVTYAGENNTLNVPVYQEISESQTPQCAKYARNVAKDLFGHIFVPADAWNIQYRNKVVSQVGKSPLESLANRGVLKPGMMVGVYNPESRYNKGLDEKGNPREYTHVVIYLGDDPKTSEPLFADQWSKETRVQTEKEMRANKLYPREILGSKN